MQLLKTTTVTQKYIYISYVSLDMQREWKKTEFSEECCV
jgi:hypothetical protein